jgi:hypothetical protein
MIPEISLLGMAECVPNQLFVSDLALNMVGAFCFLHSTPEVNPPMFILGNSLDVFEV